MSTTQGHHRTNQPNLHNTFKTLTCQVTTGQTLLTHIPKSYMSDQHKTDQHYLHHTFKNLMCKVTTGQTLPVSHIPKSHVRSPQDQQTLLTSHIPKSYMSGHHRTDKRYLHHTFKNLMCQVKENKVIRSPVQHWFIARQPSVNGCSLIHSHLVEGSCQLKEGKCLPH